MQFKELCSKCRPKIISANKIALDIYSHVQNQLLLSASGEAISLRLEAVDIFIQRCKYKNHIELLTKVLGLAEKIIYLKREKQQNDNLNKQGRR